MVVLLSVSITPVAAYAIQQPVPDKKTIKEVQKQIRLRYSEQFKANSVESQKELAKLLIEQAEVSSDSDEKYVLLGGAINASTSIGDVDAAIQGFNLLRDGFAIDHRKVRAELINGIARNLQSESELEKLVFDFQRRVDLYSEQNQYDECLQVLKLLLGAAKRSGHERSFAQLAIQIKHFKNVKKAFAAAKDAIVLLNTSPDDARANGIASNFYFFEVRNFDKGLSYMSKSNVPRLSSLAKETLQATGPTLALADAWWSMSEKSKDPLHRQCLQTYSKSLYGPLVGELSGLEKKRVEQRLAVTPNALTGMGVSFKTIWNGKLETVSTFSADGTYRRTKASGGFIFNGTWRLTGNTVCLLYTSDAADE